MIKQIMTQTLVSYIPKWNKVDVNMILLIEF